MKVVLIRHLKTQGNLEQRYVGDGDEDILPTERITHVYPEATRLFVSPLKRTQSTAKLIYPALKQEVVADLSECDFGDFKGKNYIELQQDERYQQWIASDATLPFPNGESRRQFADRCVRGFLQAVQRCSEKDVVAFVVHGGTIMAILSELGDEGKGYFDYQCTNACGYVCEWTGTQLRSIQKLW